MIKISLGSQVETCIVYDEPPTSRGNGTPMSDESKKIHFTINNANSISCCYVVNMFIYNTI